MTREQITKTFTYQPTKAWQVTQYESIRDAAGRFAVLVGDTCPESGERTLALRRIQEAVMWANAAVALHS